MAKALRLRVGSLSLFSYCSPTRSCQWMADASGGLWPTMVGTARLEPARAS